MVSIRHLIVLGALIGIFGCYEEVPRALVRVEPAEPLITPESVAAVGEGYLRVETDTDQKPFGDSTYYNVRRPYDLYSAEGEFLRRVDNEGARWGEEPVRVALPPGRYVVASQWGTTYRRVQVEVRRGGMTNVTKDFLAGGRSVFPK